MNTFIDHAAMISSKREKYPFAIANTDSSNKQGTHWWSILDIETKADYFFLFIWSRWLKTFYQAGRQINSLKDFVWDRKNDKN